MALLASLAAGLFIGYGNILAKKTQIFLGKLFNNIFLIMLMLLGANIFSSELVVNNISSIGILAVLLTASICVSSVLLTLILVSWLYPDGEKQDEKKHIEADPINLKQAITPVFAILFGAFLEMVNLNLPISYERWIYWLMISLILGIGIDIGRNREELGLIKGIGWLGFIVPFGALAGSIVGSLIFGLVTGIPSKVTVAIGAGSGFYSVTAPLVAQAAGAEYGALALIANFLRETFTIILLPLITLRFRHPALVSVGGATTMDTTLPIIARSLGAKTAMIGLVQGIILSIIVPILLPIILGI